MPITFKCVCGRELVAPDDYIGKQVRCGLCGAVRVVPQASEPAPAHPPREQPPQYQPMPPEMQAPPQGPMYQARGPRMPPQFQQPPFQAPGPQMPPGGYRPAPPYATGPYRPYGPPPYGYQAPPPPPYSRPALPPYPAPAYRPYRSLARAEDVGRAAAVVSLVLGTIGIGGNVFGCCMLQCWGVILMMACSLAAFIVGWLSLSAAAAPDVQANARLGRALGFIGAVAAIIFLIFIQIPLFGKMNP